MSDIASGTQGLASQDKAEDRGIDLLSVAATVWRGRLWVALLGLIGLGLGIWQAVYVAAPQYRATVSMALQVRNENILDFNAVVSGISGDEASMNTEMAIIKSRMLIAELVNALDITIDPEFNPFLKNPDAGPSLSGALTRVMSFVLPPAPRTPPTDEDVMRATINSTTNAIGTRSSRGTYVFAITATASSPAKAALLANTLAQIYQADQLRVKVDATESAAEWLSARVAELRIELETQQSNVATRQSQSDLISPEALDALEAELIDVRAVLQTSRRDSERLGERLAALDAATTRTEIAAAVGDGQLDAILTNLSLDAATIQNRFDRRLAQIRFQIASDRDRTISQVNERERILTELTSQFERQSASLTQLQGLQRETEATRVLYETFLTRLKETTVQEGLHQMDSRILSEATPGQLVSVTPSQLSLSYLLIGLIAGVGFVLLREALQSTFRTTIQLESTTGRSVLGELFSIPARSRLGTIDYLRSNPTSLAAEAIRNVRTSILLSDIDNTPVVIMSTSSVPGEGKTTLSLGLAHNLGGMGKRVLLVECDIRRRTFGQYFPELAGHPGILAAVSGEMPLESIVAKPWDVPVDILMGEQSTVNAADFFSSDKFRSFIDSIRAKYDYVILDTPPVLSVPDARIISRNVDAVVYSVRWDCTRRADVLEGLKQLRSVNARVAGLVLSQVSPKARQRYGYGGRYGAKNQIHSY